jgi:hypothetical protein
MESFARLYQGIVCALLFSAAVPGFAQVTVQHKEGLLHGFLVLRTVEGQAIADGDLIQNAHGDRVTSRLVFRFKDGSVNDETAVFSQRKYFRLLSDHLIQKGPSFEHPVDMTVNAATGQVTVRYIEDGREKNATEHLRLGPDLANGLLLMLLKNLPPNSPETEVAYIAPTPKPQLVKFRITPQGEESFSTGDLQRKAMHYAVKVDIGGIKGALAQLLGKKPPDIHIWVLEGEAPAFVKYEGPLAFGGPIWRIELVSPVWPHTPEHGKEKQ